MKLNAGLLPAKLCNLQSGETELRKIKRTGLWNNYAVNNEQRF